MATPNYHLDYSHKTKVSFVADSYGSHLQSFINHSDQCGPDFHLAQADVTWVFKGGWTLGKFCVEPPGFQSVIYSLPQVVFLQLGGNDLDSPLSAETVANRAISLASDLRSHGVQIVILGEVILRHKSRIPLEQYIKKVGDYNDIMRSRLIDNSQTRQSSLRFVNPSIWQWDHLQMRKSFLPLIREDGVHLTDHPGNSRLYWSVRLAFKQAIQHLY